MQSGSGSRADHRHVARHKTGIGPVQLPRADRRGNRQPTDGQRGTGAGQSSAPVCGLSAVHERRRPVGSDDRVPHHSPQVQNMVASGIPSFYDENATTPGRPGFTFSRNYSREKKCALNAGQRSPTPGWARPSLDASSARLPFTLSVFPTTSRGRTVRTGTERGCYL